MDIEDPADSQTSRAVPIGMSKDSISGKEIVMKMELEWLFSLITGQILSNLHHWTTPGLLRQRLSHFLILFP